jgi:8-oxo-dGTP pyrophosphatase MutT (NUDIX family)
MTVEERTRLLATPFDTLWTNLWNAQNTRQFRSEYETAKKTFETLRSTGDVSGRLLSKYISECTTGWSEPEWGFPKGRRSPYENEMTCAIREFCEETGLAADTLTILTDRERELEEYTGSNSIRYRHVYYIGQCNASVSVNASNRVQTREVGDIGWFFFEEAYLKIRPTNPEKRAMLGRAHHRLTN